VRTRLLAALRAHSPFDETEARMRDATIQFVETHEDCFERTCIPGHVTGSAWIVNRARTHVVLLHHGKLDKWLQPGGHCDGDADVLRVALREANEETGLTQLRPLNELIYDVDAHQIPARKQTPAHIHYDIRHLLEASGAEPIVVSEESHDVRWIALDEIARLNTDASVLRLAAKMTRYFASSQRSTTGA
jgi:8-oxo-dGTP pyrophosphatase MutT (NUDIX family)